MSKQTTLRTLAELVSGRVHGDPTQVILGADVLSDAGPGHITLIDHADRLKKLATARATAVVLPKKIVTDDAVLPTDAALQCAIIVEDAHAAFATIVKHFRPQRERRSQGIHPRATISPTARLGNGVNVHAGATIDEDCQVGDGTTILPGARLLAGCVVGNNVLIGPNVVLYEDSVVGDRVILHGGVIVGAYGFGYSHVNGKHVLSAQLGYVRIGNDVEVGAGTTIDRGTYGATTIGEGTKIDNLVQIAHNCHIGRHNLICAQVGIAGSTSTGDYVVIGGQAGIRDHVHIGKGAHLSAMAGITNDVPDGAVMLGIPATPEREGKLKLAAVAKLPEMRQEFKALRRAVAELQTRLAEGRQPTADSRPTSSIPHPASPSSDRAA